MAFSQAPWEGKATLHQVQAADGLRLAVHSLGPGDGPPLLCVPGLFSNHTAWLGTRGVGFAREAARAGFHVWVLDPRGHGASERLGGRRGWQYEDWWQHDLPAVLDHVLQASGQSTVQIVAHSAGGAAALCMLATRPRRAKHVASLCLLGTPAPTRALERRLVAASTALLALCCGGFPARLMGLGPEDEPPGVFASWMGYNMATTWPAACGLDMLAALSRVETPIFSICGAGDTLWAPPQGCWSLLQRTRAREQRFLCCGRSSGFADDLTHSGLLASRTARHELWPHMLGWLEAHR